MDYEEMDSEKHLITIAIPGEETEPKGIIAWQYIWNDCDGKPLICALLSEILEDGTEKPGRCFILMDDGKGHTAKDILDELADGMKEQLKKASEECQHPVAIVDKNPKRPMGFLVGRE